MAQKAKKAKMAMTAEEATTIVAKAMEDIADNTDNVYTPIEKLEVNFY
jgi:hypothetical protein